MGRTTCPSEAQLRGHQGVISAETAERSRESDNLGRHLIAVRGTADYTCTFFPTRYIEDAPRNSIIMRPHRMIWRIKNSTP